MSIHNQTTAEAWLEQFDDLVIQNLSNPDLTNEQLAARLSISPRKLYRTLQKLTGQSPNHYIRRLRLQKARELLESSYSITVKEVVEQVGFKKRDYFSQLFKAEFGVTPLNILQRQI